ncbi:two-component system response regulator RegX3 [Streptacidiphilus sp. BW17]|uniref:response regulator transcription factor n=1 Tax=Streptacidiphilus sp. BW17 TaxID=3156274 RepID=UPI003510F36F
MRILLTEDDSDVAEELSTTLRRHGYDVTHAPDGVSAIEGHEGFDLLLLDLGLPDLDGLEVCRRIRRTSTIPIIVVSARVAEMDRVLALKSGADDVVGKPYGFWELEARIEALMRRVAVPSEPAADVFAAPPTPASPSPAQQLRFGNVSIDPRRRQVLVGGLEVELTRKEFDLVSVLAADRGAVFERGRLMREVWGSDWFGSSRTLDVHVNSLRRKLGDPTCIETVRGVGFRLRAG